MTGVTSAGPETDPMFKRISPVVALLVSVAVPTAAVACLWDYDTLRQERSRFPSTLELLTGKFLRHSPEFYQWRADDRVKRLVTDPYNLALYDDLAVAYQKTGRYDKALATLEAKEKVKPGVYETYSNWGTVLILQGDLERGLPYIDKALAINPDAHFGREKYQKWLVEYALEMRREGKVQFPLRTRPDGVDPLDVGGFSAYLAKQLGRDSLPLEETAAAIKGVLGMMRFANHDNPLLLEALGDLLMNQTYAAEVNARHLASRAYLKASYVVKEPEVQQTYRKYADRALYLQTAGPGSHAGLKLDEVETAFKEELADGERWYAALREKEVGWIKDGKDVDAEFDALYTEDPVALNTDTSPEAFEQTRSMYLGFLGLGVSLGVGLGILVVVLIRARAR